MDAKHKDILRVNRSKLVENIGMVKDVVNHLFEQGLLTASMKEQLLEANEISTERKRSLLDMLPRRGPDAFDAFYKALVACGEDTAADIIKPELREQRLAIKKANQVQATQLNVNPQPTMQVAPVVASPVEEDLPTEWPTESYHPLSVNVVMIDHDNHGMRNKFASSVTARSGCYTMQRRIRGKVLIINNKDFSEAKEIGLNLDDREGTDMDATSLDLLFTKLGFDCVTMPDLRSAELIDALKRIREVDHDNYDSFCCFILSHGKDGGVYGIDGKVVRTQDITDMFDAQNCPKLVGKPKLFFIQACQGTKPDVGSAAAATAAATGGADPEIFLHRMKSVDEDLLSSMKQLNLSQETACDADAEQNIGSRADLFVAFATTPDYLSYRNTKRGTWFVQAITYIFQKYAHAEDLISMMTKVNNLVSLGEIKSKGHKQVSKYESTFRKKLFFFPGLFIDEGQQQQYNQIQPTS